MMSRTIWLSIFVDAASNLLLAAALLLLSPASVLAADDDYDVVIYGGNAAGVAAAVQADRMGKSVVLIEPSQHIGGLTSGGLGATDIGNKSAIGGISREFYRRVKRYYNDSAAWKQQRREEYRSPRQSKGEDTMWTFEPHVAEKILREMLAETKAVIVLGERLDRAKDGPGVTKHAARIVYITMESGRTFSGKRFLDCTYEGDLLAAAGVSYTVGREANATYGETLNGVQTAQATKHQLQQGIDPYVRPGDKSSGLLPGVDSTGPGEEGAADHRVQAYCFRMCVTDDTENRLPWTKPDDYDPLQFELLMRNFEAGESRVPWSPTLMPNRKTDTNNNFGFSTDYLGASYDWPNGDYATRQRLYREHLAYQQGLMWTLANDLRVPQKVRREVSRWGPAKDEFTDNGGWSHQLYVREARRMIGEYVMTQHDCQGRRKVDDSIALAAYTMDSHNVQRHLDAKGHVRNEGDVQVGGFGPYPIAYRSIVPKERECDNLLVPVCMSASHIAYGSIRMEPVFMVLGQSAATAACQSIDAGASVQDVDVAALQRRLGDDDQVLRASKD